ncbi:Protein polybromo-1 [Olea europaea subsp. europaea]|uniref:Protein polybromo-1 n=1 Tax=Olea europaea subsp. europaea TaxID=158383 RepID=A0A8S0TR73_OLEEU|nr:Protein polybromo-1 [Olea europaea subsp. europaea]
MRPPLIPQPIAIQEQDSKLTRILKQCYNHLVEFREPHTNRIPISLFMCLPSKKDFPKYFEIIEKPISMYEIRKRIENQYYATEQDCLADFKLMFDNCRKFNEDLSQIFQDAVNFERMLLEKFGQYKAKEHKATLAATAPPALPSTNGHSGTGSSSSNNNKNNSNTTNHLDAPPKKRLLTGYIIYAAEVRKEYVDKYPDQDFGFISRLIGNNWKTMSLEERRAYDQRALIHNKKLREKALVMESRKAHEQQSPSNHHHARKLREKAHADQQTPPINNNIKKLREKPTRDSFPRAQNTIKGPTTESATQTARVRFVEPPRKRRLVYSGYIEGLEVPELAEETKTWLGAGIGRHENTEAALWALWDFMLQDSATMRWSMQPYLSNNKPSE